MFAAVNNADVDIRFMDDDVTDATIVTTYGLLCDGKHNLFLFNTTGALGKLVLRC